MSSFAWIIIIVLLLTILGTLALLLVTLKYYWGERGKPPLTGDARRRQKEEELEKRAAQIEYSKKNPLENAQSKFLGQLKKFFKIKIESLKLLLFSFAFSAPLREPRKITQRRRERKEKCNVFTSSPLTYDFFKQIFKLFMRIISNSRMNGRSLNDRAALGGQPVKPFAL